MTGPARLLVIAAAGWLLGAGTAAAQDAGTPAGDDAAATAFRDATVLLGAGDLPAAQAAFEAVAAADPTGAWADDALSEAASVAERRGDLGAAHRLWRRILAEHPSSRQSRRARARVAAIERAIGEGGRWLAVAEEHEAILRAAAGQSDPTPQVEALVALVERNPEYPRVHDARMWIGDAWMRLARPGRAAAVYRDAHERAVAPDDRWRAAKSHGDALALSGDLDGAERIYRDLLGTGDDLADRTLRGELADLDTLRMRQQLVLAAWLTLGVALLLVGYTTWRAAGTLGRAARALARPPVEVWYFLPVALVLVVVALTGNFMVAQAVRGILLGGLAVTWLGGASLEASRRAGRLGLIVLVVHLVAATAAVAAVCYLAVMHDQLLDMLRETWHHGHD